jgi:polysaccharide pyruvyl transferase CsaB
MSKSGPLSCEKLRVLLSGWYGYDNAGDEAILEQFLVETGDWAQTYVLTGPADKITEEYAEHGVVGVSHPDWRLHRGKLLEGFRAWLQCLRILRKTDLVVLGGGGLLRDNTSWPNLLHLIDDIWIAKLLRRKTALYAIGIGPFVTSMGRALIRETVKRCDLITVRDDTSKALLEQIGVPADRVMVVADPALLLAPTPLRDADLARRLEELARKPGAIGLYLRNIPRLLEIAPQLDALHARHNMSFVAIPLCCHPGLDDRLAAMQLREAMKYPEALHVWNVPLKPAEIKQVTGWFGMNIAICLHALVFSASMGIPTVAINYEPKVANVARTLGMSDYVVELDSAFPGSLEAAILNCQACSSECSQRLRSAMARETAKAAETFTYLKALAGVRQPVRS